jgi:UDPglucose--hexose-1-phosphate uridylyltransferase
MHGIGTKQTQMAMKSKEVGNVKIFHSIQQLVDQAVKVQLMEIEDEIYARNQILSLLHLGEFTLSDDQLEEVKDIPDLLEEIIYFAVEKEIIEDVLDEKEILSSKIMNCFLSKPSEINKTFHEIYNEKPKSATNYFYQLSKNSNYIQMKRIQKNIQYQVETDYGHLDITINLSKPEKDPKQIAKEKTVKRSNYPACLLCMENEGYQGRIGHPARSNHRMIRVALNDDNWFLQYSPYVYYNEHCILLSEEHRDMKIDRNTFVNLLAFVEKFPHYFIGSNADLPIVGGSILSHDHYQGGHNEFAMAKAEEEFPFSIIDFPGIACAVVKWPMSVIRLKGIEKEALVEAAAFILEEWKSYSDPTVQIQAFSNGKPHNTITPIARIRNGLYELDLVLRNNRTDEKHPLGIFHPHEDVQHIKKENIGLIEVMGLAVLPARLKSELHEVGKMLLNQPHDVADYHLHWVNDLKGLYCEEVTTSNVGQIIQQEVGKKFLQVLVDAGVFKRDQKGIQAFKQFISSFDKK